MKKNGFTLAEVLVTLGIIGVVSAITLPALLSNTTDSQIGPKLAKAVSAFEQANEALLNVESVDTLSDARLLVDQPTYINALSRHMKINSTGDGTFMSKDGIEYLVVISTVNPNNPQDPAYQQRIGNVFIDIDGRSNGANEDATDRFGFSWWNDGSLRPWGATNWDGTNTINNYHWSVACPAGSVPDNTGFCAGHIFENNLKVLYK